MALIAVVPVTDHGLAVRAVIVAALEVTAPDEGTLVMPDLDLTVIRSPVDRGGRSDHDPGLDDDEGRGE